MILIVFFFMSLGSISYLDFMKRMCRPVEFKGQGPYKGGVHTWGSGIGGDLT